MISRIRGSLRSMSATSHVAARALGLLTDMLRNAHDVLHEPHGIGKYRGVHSLQDIPLIGNDQEGIVDVAVALRLAGLGGVLEKCGQRLGRIDVFSVHVV